MDNSSLSDGFIPPVINGNMVNYGGSAVLIDENKFNTSKDQLENENIVNITDNKKDDIDIVFINPLPKDLLCKECNQILKLPQKIDSCKHRLCLDCINKLTNCPDCGSYINHQKIEMDKDAQKRIQKLGIRCTYHDNGCKWTGELRDLKDHASKCDYSDMICPNNCGKIVSKMTLANHLDNECNKKLTTCKYCSKNIAMKEVVKHEKTCPEMIIDCPNKCHLKQVPRKVIDEHLSANKCPKSGTVCPFGEFGCDYSDNRENIQKHIKNQPVKHLSYLCDSVLSLKLLMSNIDLNNGKLNKNISLLEKKIETLEKLYGAQYIWKIDNMFHKCNEAKSGEIPYISSQPFLSGRYGYKLILLAALYGDGKGRGKYMALYIRILEGEYDAILPWPFTHKITFTLMDQNPNVNERKHHVYVVKPNASVENEGILTRPRNDRNSAFGALKFCDINDLEKYIKDDVIFIKCNIDTQNMILF